MANKVFYIYQGNANNADPAPYSLFVLAGTVPAAIKLWRAFYSKPATENPQSVYRIPNPASLTNAGVLPYGVGGSGAHKRDVVQVYP